MKLSALALSLGLPRRLIDPAMAVVGKQSSVLVSRVLGALNRSSQHFDEGGCDGNSEAAVGPMRPAANAVTRSTTGGDAGRAAAVLDVYRERDQQ